MLDDLPSIDQRVIVGPKVGTDAAAIDMGNSVLIVKSDPITFPTDDAGWYLVHVNANDIACMGGTPKWLLVTALLPESSTTNSLVDGIFSSIRRACEELDISLVGGHTEITIGLDRPILVGSMLGEATHAELIDPSRVRPEDALLLCKGIAIEGTSILAHEIQAPEVSEPVLTSGRTFLHDPGISVVQAARLIIESATEVHALHDPTEGGLATALREIAAASDCGIEIDLDQVLVYPETVAICAALGLDPLGLIASGALLAAVPRADVDAIIRHLASHSVPCAQIGTFTSEARRIRATRSGKDSILPEFEVDELARYFSSA